MRRNNTQIIHLSWDEVVNFAQALCEMIPANVVSIAPADRESRILAMMIAENLGVEYVDIAGTRVGLTNENADFSIYKILKDDEEEGEMTSINTMHIEGEEFPPRIVPPWKKL